MAGAMAPDLVYFLTVDTTGRGVSHSWLGLLIFCLPAGIVFTFAFHYLFKYHAVLNLPHPFDRLFSGLAYSHFQPKTIRAWLILITSVLIGTLSHFFWDSMTHLDGEIVKIFPWLAEPRWIFGVMRPNCRWLQHISSVAGAIFVPVYLVKARLVPSPPTDFKRRPAVRKLLFWSVIGTCGVVFAALVFYFRGYSGMVFHVLGLGTWAGMFYTICAWTVISRFLRLRTGARQTDTATR